MALPNFTDIAASEKFKALPLEKRQKITGSYWDDYEKENPADRDYAEKQRKLSTDFLALKDEASRAEPLSRRTIEANLDNTKFALLASEAIKLGKVTPEQYETAFAKHEATMADHQRKIDEVKGFVETAQKRESARTGLAQTLQRENLFGSATSAMGNDPDTEIRRTPEGQWDLPFMAPATGNPLVDTISGVAGVAAQKLGSRLDSAGVAVDKEKIRSTFDEFQKTNNLSDEDMTVAWKDLGNMNRKMKPEEKARILSDGTILPNYANSEWLDEAKATKIIDTLPTSDLSKEIAKSRLKDIQREIAGSKIEAYGAAASGTPLQDPVEWARANNRLSDFGTAKFVKDYEEQVASKSGWGQGLVADFYQGNMKLANTLAGFAGFLGSETAGKAGAEMSQASGLVGQGSFDTGMVGSVIEELPSLITQIGLTRGMGATATALGASKGAARAVGTFGALTTAGAQSAGATYSELIGAGKPEKEAREKAAKAGINTALITGLFQGIGAGGIEKFAVGGRAAGDITMREVLKYASKKQLAQNLGRFSGSLALAAGGEGLEEGLDELSAAFLNADPDTNLADAWTNALQAAKVGAVIGGTVDLAVKTFSGPTHTQGTDELKRNADAIAKNAAKENLPKIEDEGGTEPTTGAEVVVPREEMTREELQGAVEDRRKELEARSVSQVTLATGENLAPANPLTEKEQQELEVLRGTPEEIAAKYNIKLTEKSPAKGMPTDSLPVDEVSPLKEGEAEAAPKTPVEAVAGKPITAVHFSREPLKLEKGKDISSIPGRYEEDSTFGEGFYAAEPQDEKNWAEDMGRFSVGENRNDVSITPANPLTISPETVKGKTFAEIDAAVKSGNHDAIVVRGWDNAGYSERINNRVDELWTPTFPEGKTSGRFTNEEEYQAALAQAIREITGLDADLFEKLQDAGYIQNQIFIPKDSAPDVVKVTPPPKQDEKQVQETGRPPAVESQPTQPTTESKVEEGAAQRKSESEEKLARAVELANRVTQAEGVAGLEDIARAMVAAMGIETPVEITSQGATETLNQEAQQPSQPAPNASIGFITTPAGVAKAFMELGKTANASSPAHEVLHLARRVLFNRAIPVEQRVGITDAMIDEAEKFSGAKDGVVDPQGWTSDISKGIWDRKAEEKFARAWERYLRDGKFPENSVLQELYQKMAKWLQAIYTVVQGSDIDIQLTPEIKAVFDALAVRAETLAKPEVKTPAQPAARRKLPEFVGGTSLVGARRSINDETRKRHDLRKSGLVVKGTTEEQRVEDALGDIAEAERYDALDPESQAKAPNPPRTGRKLVEFLMGAPEAFPEPNETTLLVYESIQAERAVTTLRNRLKNSTDPTQPELAALEQAREYLTQVLDILQWRGSRAGLALQAYKLVTDRQFNREIMISDYFGWKNKNKPRGEWVPVSDSEIEAIEKESAEILEKVEKREVEEKKDREAIAAQEQLQVENAQLKEQLAASKKSRKAPERKSITERVKEKSRSARDLLKTMGYGRTGTLEQAAENKAQDAEYLTAVERGDMETAQRMVDAAAKRAGLQGPWLHGSDADKMGGEFRVGERDSGWFGVGAYLTNFENYAKRWGKNVHRFYAPNGKYAEATIVGNYERVDFDSATEKANRDAGGNDRWIEDENGYSKDFASSMLKQGYIGARIAFGSNKDVEVVVFDPSQIKSADPVTRDEQGKVIPLSQRFNPESPSILFQSQPLPSEALQAFADIAAEYILEGKNDAEVEMALAEDFGLEVLVDHIDKILNAAREQLGKASKGSRAKTPQEIGSLIDPDSPLSPRAIYNMAGGFLRQNIRGEAMINAILEIVRQTHPDTTYNDVVDAYTGYGKAKFPSKDAIAILQRKEKRLALITRQIGVIKQGQLPELTGLQRDRLDPNDPDDQKIRALTAERNQLMKDVGLTRDSIRQNQMRGTLSAMKTRYRNDIADLQKAIDEKRQLVKKNKTQLSPEDRAELDDLKAQKKAKRAEYNAVFGISARQLSVEQRLVAAERAMDKSIATEEAMALKGELDRAKAPPLPLTPGMKIKAAKLKALQDARRSEKRRLAKEAKDLLNPPKTESQRQLATLEKSLQRSIDRYEYFLKNGEFPAKKDGTVYSREDFPLELFNLRNDMQDAVAYLRASETKLAPLESRKRDATIRLLERAQESLQNQITSGLWTDGTGKPSSTDPRVLSLRETNKIMRSVVDRLKKADPNWVETQEQKLDAALIKASQKRLAKWEGMLARGEFTDPAKIKRTPSKALERARFEEQKVKQAWLDQRAEWNRKNASFIDRQLHRAAYVSELSNVVTLGSDLILGRQGIVATILNPGTIGAKWVRTLLNSSEQGEYNLYNRLNDPEQTPVVRYVREANNKQFKLLAPHDGSANFGKEDMPRPEVIEKIAKIPVLGLPFKPIRWIERMNRMMHNEMTVQMLEAQLSPQAWFFAIKDPTKAQVDTAVNAAMVAVRRGSFKSQRLDTAVEFANMFTISMRFLLSGLQYATLQPVLTRRGGYKGTLKIRARVAYKLYFEVLGRTAIAATILGRLAFGDDEEKWKRYKNPLDRKFMLLEFDGIEYNFLKSITPHISVIAKMFAGYKVDGDVVTPLRGPGAGYKTVEDEWNNFLYNRRNLRYALAFEALSGKHYGGEDATSLSLALKAFTPINFKTDAEIAQAQMPSTFSKGVAIAAVHLGINAQIKKDKQKKSSSTQNPSQLNLKPLDLNLKFKP